MGDNICVNTNTFVLILLLNIGIIVWCLYQVYIKEFEQDAQEDTIQQIESIIDRKMAATVDNNNYREPDLTHNYPQNVPVTPFYTPTRGEPTDFYVVGYLTRKNDPDRMLKLYERYLYGGRYEYCTENHNNPTIQIPIYNRNYEQLSDGDHVKVPGYKGDFKVRVTYKG